MFAKRSLGGIWKPKNPHSLEYLKYLHGVLNKNAVVTENNRSLLVEALRAIAEILIWGDQNDPSVFDFFLEKNMLGFFLRIMKQKCGRYVCTQLLQTLNILFENISNETSLYYLLSNNHVNSIITHRFDFSDEEILAYYISFLKTLSLKLNNNTIHFFFNEHTNDFPLYTEAIKFFNHSESMVRIAVRTLTLNVYRVNDTAMLNFIRDNAAAPYFSNFVFFIANHVVDMNACLLAADGSSLHSRDKLADLMAEHLDHIHYMNDVLCLNIDSLNAVLTEQLLKKLFVPIYLGCLSPDYRFEGAARVSPVVALFLLSQVFLVVTHTPLVERLAGLLMLGDGNALCNEGAVFSATGSDCVNSFDSNKTDEEKLQTPTPRGDDPLTKPDTLGNRPLLKAVLESLDCSRDDHAAFFALCLVFSIYQNAGISPALLQCAQLLPEDGTNGTYCTEIVWHLVRILAQSVLKDCRVRVATLETCCVTFKQILRNADGRYSSVSDQFLADLVSARETIVEQLRHYAEHEDLFLDLFEDEYRQVQTRNFSMDLLSTDASMLLPPSDTPLSGVDFVKRLPCGPQEHARRAIRVFLLIRELLQDISGEEDDFPRAFTAGPIVKVDDCLNLNNSDLLACTVVAKDGSKTQRFLVTGGLQLMLVEPDTKKLGWGVVRFAGFLQDCEVVGDKEDSRALAITVFAPAAKARPTSHQLLSAKLIFDDHIRCMAAKQRLTKGRQKARQYKMDVISHLLELRRSSESTGEILLPPPPLLSNVVGRQVPGYVAVDHSRRRNEGEQDQPSTNEAPANRKSSAVKQPSSRRRVRVLSAECVAKEGGGAEQTEEAEHVDTSTKSPAEGSDDVEAVSFVAKRSSSLSPRVVPRFGISTDEQKTPPVEKKGVVSTLFRARGSSAKEEAGLELRGVEVREDPGSPDAPPPSLQCFVGKRKVSSQVLDI